MHIGKIFLQVPHDFASLSKRREHIDKAKHLHFEMLVAHGKRHHALIKTGLAENRFRIAVDQFENPFASALNLLLESFHKFKMKITRGLGLAKLRNFFRCNFFCGEMNQRASQKRVPRPLAQGGAPATEDWSPRNTRLR